MRIIKSVFQFVIVSAFLGGCSHSSEKSTFADLHDAYFGKNAKPITHKVNPVIIIPGFMGSKLVEASSGRVLWGDFSGAYITPESPEGQQLWPLPFSGAQSTNYNRVRSLNVITEFPLLGPPWDYTVPVYKDLLGVFGNGAESTQPSCTATINQGIPCFQFSYDWRKDIVETAFKLHQFIENIRRSHFASDPDLKFNVVAHSMGGLILRYYLLYGAQDLPSDGRLPDVTWNGSRHIEKAVLIAPPNGGTSEVLFSLLRGRRLIYTPYYNAGVLGTFPSLYQMLPRSRQTKILVNGNANRQVRDLLSIQLWKKLRWGLLAPHQEKFLESKLSNFANSQDRYSFAENFLTFQLNRARSFQRALDRRVPALPAQLSLYLFAGDSLKTPKTLSVDFKNGDLSVFDYEMGDRLVSKESALMDESGSSGLVRYPIPWTGVYFFKGEHSLLTQNPDIAKYLLFLFIDQI